MSTHTRSALRLIASGAFLLATSLACTVIRDDPDPPRTDGGVGITPSPGDPREVDLLVMADLDPSAAHLAGHYAQIVGAIEGAIAEHGIVVRSSALAPLHHRVGASVPLLGHASPEELASLVAYYAGGDGAVFLHDAVGDDYENLLALGPELHQTPLYTESAEGEAYFRPAADGFVVVVLGALAARCGAGSCDARAAEVATALTSAGESGASWLVLPGEQNLPPSRIAYLFVTSPEVDGSYSAMVESCRAYPNFPTVTLDFMEPSVELHSLVASGIAERGGRARWIDFCAALSSQSDGLFAQAGSLVATAANER